VIQSGCVGATGSDATIAGDAAGLNASPAAVSFGNVNTGSTSTRTVTVANSGSADVTVSNISLSGAGFDASGVPAGLILAPGQNATLAVSFAPASAGSVTGEVKIANDATSSPIAVVLSGTGVAAGSHSVRLSWNASTSNVVGYKAYRSTTSGGPYSALSSSPNAAIQFTDPTVESGKVYYYVVTAVDADNVESTYSNQATATVPTP
jgi:fibronectin type 3 domain-containing protein